MDVRYRWVIELGDPNTQGHVGHRAFDRILAVAVAPVVRDPQVRCLAPLRYAARHTDTSPWSVWLVMVAPEYVEARLRQVVARHAGSLACEYEKQNDPKVEPLLRPECRAHCDALTGVTDIALDLVDSPAQELERHRCLLIGLGSISRKSEPSLYRYVLHPYLSTHSATYAGFSRHERLGFWSTFFVEGLHGSDPCHFLWNVVGVPDPIQADPDTIARALGVDCG